LPAQSAVRVRRGRDPLGAGPDTTSDKLRQCASCTGCGQKGAVIQHPSWGGNGLGFLPFPVDA